jgi:hypothetical protein
MASFTVEIPDYLLPALVAEFSLVQGKVPAATPEEYFKASVVEIIRQRAEIYKVGPYFVGAVDPQFNQDGTPYGWAPPPERPAALTVGQTWIDGSGQEWAVVQAINPDGTFAADDPETPERESLAWVQTDGGGDG